MRTELATLERLDFEAPTFDWVSSACDLEWLQRRWNRRRAAVHRISPAHERRFNLEGLSPIFAAYFHQDWDLEADDGEGIADSYAADHASVELLRRLAQEIDELRHARPEVDLAQFLGYAVGAYYEPSPLTYKQWLGQIAERLRQRANAADTGSSSL